MNLGDLCADAFRYVMDADIGYVNGGGLREALHAGDITFNDLLNVFPFNNQVVLAEVSGQTIKDMLELTMMNWPVEDSSFPHMSGLTFSVNTNIPSSVMLNEQEEFCGVSGQYRVYNIKVFDNETQIYEPLKLTDTYTLASQNYFILEYGSGMTMFEEAKILKNDGMLDVKLFEQYVVESLNGVIGQQYKDTTPNITFTEGELSSSNDMDSTLWIIGVAAGLIILLLVILILKRIKTTRCSSSHSAEDIDVS